MQPSLGDAPAYSNPSATRIIFACPRADSGYRPCIEYPRALSKTPKGVMLDAYRALITLNLSRA